MSGDAPIDTIETRLYINGEFVPSTEGATFPVYNPAACELVAEVHEASSRDVDTAVAAALAAFPAWSRLSVPSRGTYLRRLSTLLRSPAVTTSLARLDSLCIGRSCAPGTYPDAHAAADGLEYYAAVAEEVCCGETRAFTNDGENGEEETGVWGFTIKQPYGVVAAILPWNVPVGMFCWKVGAAVAAGNTVVVKSSEKSPLSCLKLASLIHAAGFPPGVITVLSGPPATGAFLASHPLIRHLTFTGSLSTGRIVQTLAANSNLKTVTLELGGKNAAIVFGDLQLRGEEKVKDAAQRIAGSVRLLMGQTCFANGRVLVERGFEGVFVREGLWGTATETKAGRLFEEAFLVHNAGPMVDPATGGGGLEPLADRVQFERVSAYIEQARRQGATVQGGERIGDRGYFLTPAVIRDLPPHSPLLREEVFGPVVVFQTFASETEAITLANNTEYGLYASVFTGCLSRAMRVTRALECGLVGINTTSPEMARGVPFGGWKGSGVGREVMKAGLVGMMEVKSVTMRY